MTAFIWRDLVKVVTGELTRGAQLAYWRDLTAMDAEQTEVLLSEIDEVLAVRATRALYVCRDGEWVPVEETGTFTVDEDAYTLTMPPTREGLRALPASLANTWVKQAQQDNEVLREYLFFTSPTADTTTAKSEPPSDDEA